MRAEIEKEHGVRTMYSAANLAHALEIEQMVGTASETFGAIDILVNNAVVRYAAPVEQFPVGEWDLGNRRESFGRVSHHSAGAARDAPAQLGTDHQCLVHLRPDCHGEPPRATSPAKRR